MALDGFVISSTTLSKILLKLRWKINFQNYFISPALFKQQPDMSSTIKNYNYWSI